MFWEISGLRRSMILLWKFWNISSKIRRRFGLWLLGNKNLDLWPNWTKFYNKSFRQILSWMSSWTLQYLFSGNLYLMLSINLDKGITLTNPRLLLEKKLILLKTKRSWSKKCGWNRNGSILLWQQKRKNTKGIYFLWL